MKGELWISREPPVNTERGGELKRMRPGLRIGGSTFVFSGQFVVFDFQMGGCASHRDLPLHRCRRNRFAGQLLFEFATPAFDPAQSIDEMSTRHLFAYVRFSARDSGFVASTLSHAFHGDRDFDPKTLVRREHPFELAPDFFASGCCARYCPEFGKGQAVSRFSPHFGHFKPSGHLVGDRHPLGHPAEFGVAQIQCLHRDFAFLSLRQPARRDRGCDPPPPGDVSVLFG